MLEMFTIYQSPLDYPGKFVVRRWESGRPPKPDAVPTAVCRMIHEARAKIPPMLICTLRHPDDDPVIVETWF
jgi:hypothetical protein